MKGRKEHVITSIKGDAQPARLIALSVTAECDGEADGLGWQRERLVSWSSCGWERSKAGAYRHWSVTHGDVERWWRAIMWGAKRSGVTWIVSMRSVRVCSILGLWRLIDEGRIQWDGSEPPGTRNGHDRRDVRSVCATDVHGGQGGHGSHRHAVPDVSDLLRSPGGRGVDAQSLPQTAPSSVALDDPPTVLRLRVPGLPGRLLFLDSRNWGVEPPDSLATAPEEAQWLAGTMRAMVDELVTRGWGGLRCTAGSQSLATWRRAFMTTEVVAHADSDILDLERRAYVGGRCEAGRLGEIPGPLYMVDRRSAYAAACADLDIPCRILRRCDGDLEGLGRDPERCGRTLAEVGVDETRPCYPHSARDGVRYPVGRFACVLGGPELRDAVERGVVRWIGAAVEYECRPALRLYAEALWRLRCDLGEAGRSTRDGSGAGGRTGDGPHAGGSKEGLTGWVKKMLVGLPGKLGQRDFQWTAVPNLCPPAPWFAWWGISREREIYRLRALGGAVQRQERGGWSYDAVPAAAVWVLSHARVQLLRAIRICGWDHCLYWDTDSLLLDQAGYDSLRSSAGLMGDGLGQWRLVRQVRTARIHGPKYYDHDGVITCAGMPRADVASTRLQDRYWYRQTFGTALAEGHAPQAGRRLREYSRAPGYHLGRVGDGGKVYPHVRSDF